MIGDGALVIAALGVSDQVVGTDEWKLDVLPRDEPIYGHRSGELLPLNEVREGREREISLMDDRPIRACPPVRILACPPVRHSVRIVNQ